MNGHQLVSYGVSCLHCCTCFVVSCLVCDLSSFNAYGFRGFAFCFLTVDLRLNDNQLSGTIPGEKFYKLYSLEKLVSLFIDR